MKESEKVKVFPILYLNLDLNVQNKAKAERILKLIQSAINVPIYIEEIYEDGKNEFTVFCYIVSEFEKPNDSIVWTLTTLDKIGQEWYIESPNLKHQKYWKFKGTKSNEWKAFKINGITKVDFELANLEREKSVEMIIEQ